jgi:hypothetical protein
MWNGQWRASRFHSGILNRAHDVVVLDFCLRRGGDAVGRHIGLPSCAPTPEERRAAKDRGGAGSGHDVAFA